MSAQSQITPFEISTKRLVKRPPVPAHGDGDSDFAPAYQGPGVRFKPGIYTLRCVAVRLRHMFGAHKCELKFQFSGTDDFVSAYLHMGRGPKPHVGPGSNYTKLWMQVRGDKFTRGDRMAAKAFKWCWFECEVGDVIRTHDGKTHYEPYSVVKKVIRAVQS